MPHFQTIQAFRDQAFDLFVGQQPPVAAQIPRMGDHRNATGGLHRGDHIMRSRRRRGNVVLAGSAHHAGERFGTGSIHAGRHQRIGDMRPADGGAHAFMRLNLYAVPRNRIVLGDMLHHALGAP